MDLVAADPRGGSQVLADVVVADPTRSTAVMVTVVDRGHGAAARLAAEMKDGKYGDHFPNNTFVPHVRYLETYGCPANA
jgi:predicted NAD/FAD-dependent oxidoreductase